MVNHGVTTNRAVRHPFFFFLIYFLTSPNTDGVFWSQKTQFLRDRSVVVRSPPPPMNGSKNEYEYVGK